MTKKQQQSSTNAYSKNIQYQAPQEDEDLSF